MRNRLLFLVGTLILPFAVSKAQMVVTNPESDALTIVQDANRTAEHGERLKEIVKQTRISLEELDMRYSEYQKDMALYEKRLNKGLEATKKVTCIFEMTTSVLNRFNWFKNQLVRNEYLSNSEKVILLADASAVVSILIKNKETVFSQAKKEANITEKEDAYKNMEALDKIVEAIRNVDNELMRTINRANRLISAKRNLIESVQSVHGVFAIKY